MKVFTTTAGDFGFWVGTAAVVVARDRGHARKLLIEAGAKDEELELSDFLELDLETEGALVLQNGDY